MGELIKVFKKAMAFTADPLSITIMHKRHTYGVRIVQLDGELPKYPYPLVTQIAGEMEVVDTWSQVYDDAQKEMLKKGYKYPVIEEETNGISSQV